MRLNSDRTYTSGNMPTLHHQKFVMTSIDPNEEIELCSGKEMLKYAQPTFKMVSRRWNIILLTVIFSLFLYIAIFSFDLFRSTTNVFQNDSKFPRHAPRIQLASADTTSSLTDTRFVSYQKYPLSLHALFQTGHTLSLPHKTIPHLL